MSFKFAIIVVLYALTEILAQDDCTQGKSYWCHSLSNAKACNAVKECLNVWRNEHETVNDDSNCNECKEIISKVEIYAEGEEEEKLRDELENKCSAIELEKERRKCVSVADGLSPEIASSMMSNLSPQKICSIIGSCPRSVDDKQKNKETVASPSDVEYDVKPGEPPRPMEKRVFKKIYNWGWKAVDWLTRPLAETGTNLIENPQSVQNQLGTNQNGLNRLGQVLNALNQIRQFMKGQNKFGQTHFGQNTNKDGTSLHTLEKRSFSSPIMERLVRSLSVGEDNVRSADVNVNGEPEEPIRLNYKKREYRRGVYLI